MDRRRRRLRRNADLTEPGGGREPPEQHVANGRKFAVSNYLESGDQVSVTLRLTGPPIPDSVQVTRVFTFRPGTNIVVQMNDGVDVLALRSLWADYDAPEEDA